jgi:TPR repeat protein
METNMKPAIRCCLLGIALTMALARSAAAGPIEDGMEAYQEKDYVKAIQLWRPLAETGDATAQYQIGTLYAEGKGVARDDVIAASWFRKAAEKGNANAQYDLGASYAEGLGVKKDDVEAAAWFRRAADQRMGFAQLNLGMMYAAGRGVPQDNIEALKWIELSVYSLPPGAARSDAARALKDVADKMNSEQILEAKGRARAWKPAAPAPVVEPKTEAKPAAK